MQKVLMWVQFIAAGIQLAVMVWLAWYSVRSYRRRMEEHTAFHKFQTAMLESVADAVNTALGHYEARLEKLEKWAQLRGLPE